jgi:hypothetical protein
VTSLSGVYRSDSTIVDPVDFHGAIAEVMAAYDFPACCARAGSGHAAAAPPSSVMNSRLLIR